MIIALSACGGGNSDGKISTPGSADDFVGANYQDVVTQLEAAGFTNVTTDVLDDLVTGWLTEDGEVERVSINGETDFSDGAKYDAGVPVIVTYHTFPEEEAAEPEESPDIVEENNDPPQNTTPTDDDNDIVDTISGLSPENNPDVAAVLASSPDDYALHKEFAETHIGTNIEFDGCIGLMMNHGNYDTRFDCAIYSVDYDETPVLGPTFAFIDVNYSDFNIVGANPSGSIGQGNNIHVVGKILGFSSDGNYIELEPVETRIR
jgi:hypothetical protein